MKKILKRVFLVWLSVNLVGFVVSFIRSFIKTRRTRQLWNTIPRSQWNEMAVKLQYGNNPPPLDPIQVVADVCAWLRDQQDTEK